MVRIQAYLTCSRSHILAQSPKPKCVVKGVVVDYIDSSRLTNGGVEQVGVATKVCYRLRFDWWKLLYDYTTLD
jgi:hypothetical protein